MQSPRDPIEDDKIEALKARMSKSEMFDYLEDRVDALEAENARLREALAYYADRQNWLIGGLGHARWQWVGNVSPFEIARKALEGDGDA
jgi:hypothetical protein